MRLRTEDNLQSRDVRVLEVTGGGTTQTEVDGHVKIVIPGSTPNAIAQGGPLTQDLAAGGNKITGLGDIAMTGLTGATSPARWVGATASGAPASGTFVLGDWITTLDGKMFVCTTAGTPGVWTQVGGSLDAASSAASRAGWGINGRGLLCENWPIANLIGNGQAAGDHLYLMGNLGVISGDTVTGVALSISQLATGTNPSHVFVGLYDASLARLATSSDLAASALFTAATGLIKIPFSAPYVSPAGKPVYAAFGISGAWGTQQPKFAESQGATYGAGAQLGTGMMVFSDFNTGGLGSLPGTATLNSTSNNPFWAGLY